MLDIFCNAEAALLVLTWSDSSPGFDNAQTSPTLNALSMTASFAVIGQLLRFGGFLDG